jgi:hypothetical protein
MAIQPHPGLAAAITRHTQNAGVIRDIIDYARQARSVWEFGTAIRNEFGNLGEEISWAIEEAMEDANASWQQALVSFNYMLNSATDSLRGDTPGTARQNNIFSQELDRRDSIGDWANQHDPFPSSSENGGRTPINSGGTPVRDVGIGGRPRTTRNPPMDASGPVEPVPEASAARAGGGGGPGNPVSKETPVSQYPSLSYGLQETHTTILPWVGWCSLSLDSGNNNPVQMKLRMNAIWDMLDFTILAAPAAGAAYPTGGFFNKKANRDGKTVLVGTFPTEMTAGTTTTERPQWRDYWAQMYEYYTVLGCEYEIIHMLPGKDYDILNATPATRQWSGDIIVAEQFDSYSDTAGSTGNVMPNTTLNETMNFKNIKWHKIGIDDTSRGGGTLIVSGRYTPGQIKRNISNDGDVKTWTKTSTGATVLPTLKEFLTLNYWRHPLSPGSYWNANIQIRLKYIVQFKDLVSIARYPNSLAASVPVDQIISNIPANDDVMQKL